MKEIEHLSQIKTEDVGNYLYLPEKYLLLCKVHCFKIVDVKDAKIVLKRFRCRNLIEIYLDEFWQDATLLTAKEFNKLTIYP